MHAMTRGLAVAVMAVALLAGACGGGDVLTSITVSGTEFEFTEDAWTIAANTDTTVTFTNTGTLGHEWAVLTVGTKITQQSEFNEEIVEIEVEVVDPGASGSIVLNLPAGEYQVICALEGHMAGGMTGILTVQG